MPSSTIWEKVVFLNILFVSSELIARACGLYTFLGKASLHPTLLSLHLVLFSLLSLSFLLRCDNFSPIRSHSHLSTNSSML